jgi:hypothetical protein
MFGVHYSASSNIFAPKTAYREIHSAQENRHSLMVVSFDRAHQRRPRHPHASHATFCSPSGRFGRYPLLLLEQFHCAVAGY